MSQGEVGAELRALAEWRQAVLERVLWLCLALMSVAIVLSFYRPYIFERRVFAVALLPGWLLVTTATLWPRAPVWLRQFALVLGLLTVSVGSVAKLGFQAVNGFCAHLMLVVMVALLAGRRAAWVVWAIGLLSWTVIALFASQDMPSAHSSLFDPNVAANWRRVILIYAAVSAITVVVVSYLVERMESALRRSEALYTALTKESSERIASLEEQRVLEQQLRQSQKLESLGTLAGGVAHDFNNLLSIIVNYAELAALRSQSVEVREALDHVLRASERAASLTRRLLAFGRRQVAERKVLDVNARVEESLQLLRRLLPASIELERELATSRPSVWAAEIEIDQIIMNLCVNARDAMPAGGKLTVRVRAVSAPGPDGEHRDFVCVEIEDTGMGMDEATRARVFEPFFTTKPPGQGTGLGLSTVHGVVHQAGGFVEVDSRPGHGTRVRVLLPRHAGSVPPRELPASARRRGHETLLVVDDDPVVRQVLARRLQDRGYRVITCQDGEEALRVFRDHSKEIALVLSDAVMPKLGGRALHRAICEEYGEIPFVICSGYAAQTIEPEFFSHPSRAFLAKPFNEESLHRCIGQLLDAAGSASEEGTAGTFTVPLVKPSPR
jgi:signal transduction histidine kinase/ActR/RegA family two-component response regulator